MKYINRSLFLILLAVGLILGLCACADKNTELTSISAYKSVGAYTDLGADQMTLETLDALPKKYAGMPTNEAREAVVAFWRYCKTALWMPDARYDIYQDDDAGVPELKRWVEKGYVYAGMPYVHTGTGNIYRLFDFMDPETGVVNVKEAGRYPVIFGNMCSSGCYWSWARVMNSADYRWCNDSVYTRGYLPVGPYTYNLSITKLVNESDTHGTDDICRENGEQVMYQSYAALDIADGLITVWEKNGHTIMCTVAPEVVYNEDGTINGRESFIHITEQGGTWDPGVSAGGIPYEYEYSLDKKFTFQTLWERMYIPFTFADLIGTEPIEETEVSFTHTGDTITERQLFDARVSSNYHISDIYVMVYDKAGNEVFKHAVRARVPSTKEMKVHKIVDQSYTWGDWDDLDPKKDYTVKVEVQLGTGERPVVWEGKLAQ